MNHDKLFALDLAKTSIQGALLSARDKVEFNRRFSRQKLITWLRQQAPMTVAMEACSTSHHWGRMCEAMGHQVRLVPTRTAHRYRQGHKTDANDAVAVGVAARQPNTRFASLKTIDQQGLQSIQRMRQHLLSQRLATSNMIRSLLGEFGLVIPKGIAAFKRAVPEILEVIDDRLPMCLRFEMVKQWADYQRLDARVTEVDHTLNHLIAQHAACQQLQTLPGIGPINALGLYLVLNHRGQNFAHGREAAACIGLTPQQYSTGGRVTLGRISPTCANKPLRSSLIQGARTVIIALKRRAPQNQMEAWLAQLVARRGAGRAAVGFANKLVRVAWALLHKGDEFVLHPNLA